MIVSLLEKIQFKGYPLFIKYKQYIYTVHKYIYTICMCTNRKQDSLALMIVKVGWH